MSEYLNARMRERGLLGKGSSPRKSMNRARDIRKMKAISNSYEKECPNHHKYLLKTIIVGKDRKIRCKICEAEAWENRTISPPNEER